MSIGSFVERQVRENALRQLCKELEKYLKEFTSASDGARRDIAKRYFDLRLVAFREMENMSFTGITSRGKEMRTIGLKEMVFDLRSGFPKWMVGVLMQGIGLGDADADIAISEIINDYIKD